jgi:hypothetical protein
MVPTLAAVLSDPLGSWPVWEVALAAVALAVGGAAAAVGLAWRALLLKRAAAAEFAGDETGAGALGAALGSAHPWIDAGTIADVWAAHAALPADRRRELALAVVGLVRGSGPATWYALRESIKSAVRGFVPKAVPTLPTGPTPLPEELLASAYGGLVATIAGAGAETVPAALATAYAELSGEWRAALVHALSGFVGANPADEIDDWEPKALDGIAAFRAAAPRAPAPTHALAALFGVALGRSGASAGVEPVRVLWGAFADAPPDLRPAINSALTGLSAAGEPDDPDAQLLAVATTFRAPEPASAHA